jgi:phosphate starvation-inducible protein PhoH
VRPLGNQKNTIETLVGQNEELSKVVEKAAKLTVLNTRGSAFKVRGKEISTDKASRADMLKISLQLLKIK